MEHQRHRLAQPAPIPTVTSLHPPVQPALARPAPAIDGRVPRGDVAYEPKWDGLRCLAFRHDTGVVLQAGRSQLVTQAFPEVAAAVAASLPPGTVADGELISWTDGRLDVSVLYSRLGASTPGASVAASRHPVSLVLFDVLLWHHDDVRALPYAERRAAVEEAASGSSDTLSATAVTTDPLEADQWYDQWPAFGIEGVMVKPLIGQYLSGQRIWSSVRRRTVTTAVVGGVLGNPARPVALVAGRPTADGSLSIVGTTRPLPEDARRELGSRLRRASGNHPWPAAPLPPAWMGRTSSAEQVSYIRVVPDVAVEVVVDAAWPQTRWGHPGELRRVLPDPPKLVRDVVSA